MEHRTSITYRITRCLDFSYAHTARIVVNWRVYCAKRNRRPHIAPLRKPRICLLLLVCAFIIKDFNEVHENALYHFEEMILILARNVIYQYREAKKK